MQEGNGGIAGLIGFGDCILDGGIIGGFAVDGNGYLIALRISNSRIGAGAFGIVHTTDSAVFVEVLSGAGFGTGADRGRIGGFFGSFLRCRNRRTLGTFIVALVGFHCFCIAAGIVMAAVLVGAKELVAAIVAVYLHLAYMGAGSTLGGRGITAGIITGGMSAGLTLNRCHVAAVPGVVTFGVSLSIGAGGTCHGFYIAAALVMDMTAGNFSGSLAVAAVTMDMAAIQLHGDAAVIYSAFMGAVSTICSAALVMLMDAHYDGIAILAMLMGAGTTCAALAIAALGCMLSMMLT